MGLTREYPSLIEFICRRCATKVNGPVPKILMTGVGHCHECGKWKPLASSQAFKKAKQEKQ